MRAVDHLPHSANTMTLLTTSDWPSVWGWKAVLMRRVTPAIRNKSRHTLPVKTGSRLLTIEDGNPCSRTTPSKKARATEAAVYGWLSVMKWAYFEKR
jgi:hypothetical protein